MFAHDRLAPGSEIYTRTVAHRDALTVDYHCAWDQGKHLWMIYSMHRLRAPDKPDPLCCGRTATPLPDDHNPYSETAPGRLRVGDSGTCSARHLLELRNLKAIAEYRPKRPARHPALSESQRSAMNNETNTVSSIMSMYLPFGDPVV